MGGFGEAAALAGELVDALTGPAGRGITRWIVVALFATAGAAKLRRPLLAAMAMVDFGILDRPRKRLAVALGASEMVVALLVAVPPTSDAGMLAALVLLSSFVAVTLRALATKRDVACFCLGDPDSRISVWSGVRTAALAAAVALQVTGPATASTPAGGDGVMYAVAGCGSFATALLVARVPRLFRWNSDVVRFVEEEAA